MLKRCYSGSSIVVLVYKLPVCKIIQRLHKNVPCLDYNWPVYLRNTDLLTLAKLSNGLPKMLEDLQQINIRIADKST